MSSDKQLDLATSYGKEEKQQRQKAQKHTRDGKKKKTMELKWDLELEEANKSFYMCCLEHSDDWVAYVVRTIKLGDLLSSSPVTILRQVAYEAGSHLPASVGCGVLGSQIVITGGVKPSNPYGLDSICPDSSVWETDVYAFEASQSNGIRKLDANLKGAKLVPLMVEVAGKLYALSNRWVGDPSFEVFDPKLGRWEDLPQPPFFDSESEYYHHGRFSYAIGGTKIFASHEECPVFCFDVAHPNREWRMVSTMCQGDCFPFDGEALVLDLEWVDDDKKLLFAYSHERWRLGVYLMSLSENKETITKIGDMRMPGLPDELGPPRRCKFLHIGGQKACLVVSQIGFPDPDDLSYNQLGTHKTHGAVIPFLFELDINKVDKDRKNCLTLQFMPLRCFEYLTNPSTLPIPDALGCCLL